MAEDFLIWAAAKKRVAEATCVGDLEALGRELERYFTDKKGKKGRQKARLKGT
jgi:hypothetical protein